MNEPTGREKILTWIEERTRKVDALACDNRIRILAGHPVGAQCAHHAINDLPRTLAALEEAVSVIDSECLPGEIDAAFERLLDILNGKREEPNDGR